MDLLIQFGLQSLYEFVVVDNKKKWIFLYFLLLYVSKMFYTNFSIKFIFNFFLNLF